MQTVSIPTSRFGDVVASPDEVILFPKGMIGLERYRRWLLLSESQSSLLGWLQAVDDAETALAVVDANRFVEAYRPTFSGRELESLALGEAANAVALTIVTRDARGTCLNLQAPVLLNLEARRGAQVVCQQTWPVRFPLGLSGRELRKSA